MYDDPMIVFSNWLQHIVLVCFFSFWLQNIVLVCFFLWVTTYYVGVFFSICYFYLFVNIFDTFLTFFLFPYIFHDLCKSASELFAIHDFQNKYKCIHKFHIGIYAFELSHFLFSIICFKLKGNIHIFYVFQKIFQITAQIITFPHYASLS